MGPLLLDFSVVQNLARSDSEVQGEPGGIALASTWIMQEKKRRGFAAMAPAKQRAIASKGGQSVPAEKRSFARRPELARAAGRKGGEHVPAAKRTFTQDPSLAARAGRKGGESRGGEPKDD
jgi:general stress protein YciG